MVNLVFPDQYGRLAGIKINAEYFLETVDSSKGSGAHFLYRHNPFRYDICGSEIDFGEDENAVKLPKSLLLKPDFSTIKEVPWQKKEALVLADVLDPKDETLISYAPRNLLKTVVSSLTIPSNLTTQLAFTFAFHKHPGKEEKEEKKKNSARD